MKKTVLFLVALCLSSALAGKPVDLKTVNQKAGKLNTAKLKLLQKGLNPAGTHCFGNGTQKIQFKA